MQRFHNTKIQKHSNNNIGTFFIEFSILSSILVWGLLIYLIYTAYFLNETFTEVRFDDFGEMNAELITFPLFFLFAIIGVWFYHRGSK